MCAWRIGSGRCITCGNPTKRFTSRRHALACSAKCRRSRAARRTKAPRVIVLCGYCGIGFDAVKPQHRFCSARCRYKAGIESSICKKCGSEYRRKSNTAGHYCSRECSFTHQTELRIAREIADGMLRCLLRWLHQLKPCRICGSLSTRVVCSDECEKEAARRHGRAHYRPTPERMAKCADCGSVISWRGRGGYRLYCKKCAKRRDKKSAPSDARKRCRKYGTTYEYINKNKVFVRDNWKCGICGLTTDKTVLAPHPRSPSLDHIVPISKGGNHTYSNVQCACFECNWMKGTTIGFTRRVHDEQSAST